MNVYLKEFLNILFTMLLWLLIIWWIIFILIIAPILFIEKYTCENKYEDSYYKILIWCFVNYEWKYITEKLYEKAFTQNINIRTYE